ncbi:hypothetical protein ASF70_13020 [Rhizobium sp. Leaf321]|uniref:hypothetical protein n=1 Tax=Rhizobium sp. Leaf321 TaxID=1736335 RepID=UPI000713901C|nr:hypothetical protein [Rhizobium sp. Leaf321]KQQ72446.1 hypothetical protein ASF70_13020 [Rhizobium sp. Leaf321]
MPQAAAVLDVSERTLKRIRTDEEVSIKDSITAAAQSYLQASRTTVGTDAEQVDSWASQAGLADLCVALPYAHVTAITSAIARGWTSANSAKLRQVAQPIRMPQPETVSEFRLEWYATSDLPWGVECRVDSDGRPYRIASIERTLLELAAYEGFLGADDVVECFKGAQAAEQRPDMQMVRRKARERGPEIIEKVEYCFASRPWESLE